MAVFDLAAQRMCIRVVYDGVANAGKTTNLKQLCGLFATQQATEVYSPGEAEGRTLFFDWVQIAAGAVCGFPLICQVITVPGQVVLTPRRRQLLASADVVVYVTESHPHALPRAREGLAVLDEIARERGEALPVVVQANKQDQAAALDGQGVLEALGKMGLPVLEAIATDGIGVVDTFVAAVRSAARSLEALSEAGKLRLSVRRSETSAELYARLSNEPVDPEWAVEMLLEEASDAFLMASLDLEAERSLESPRSLVEADHRSTQALALVAADTKAVPFPRSDVPTGFIWPAHTGRKSLAALAAHRPETGSVALDASGTIEHAAGNHVLRTGTRWRFADAEAARHALVRAARERSQLGPLLVPDTVLVVEQTSDGSSWLWTISTTLSPLPELLKEEAVDREGTLRRVGRALVEAVRMALRHGLYLDADPSRFGDLEGTLRYAGDIVPVDDESRSPSHVLARALVGLEAMGAPLDTVLQAVSSGIGGAAEPEEVVAIGRRLATLDRTGMSPAVREAVDRLSGALARVSEAA